MRKFAAFVVVALFLAGCSGPSDSETARDATPTETVDGELPPTSNVGYEFVNQPAKQADLPVRAGDRIAYVEFEVGKNKIREEHQRVGQEPIPVDPEKIGEEVEMLVTKMTDDVVDQIEDLLGEVTPDILESKRGLGPGRAEAGIAVLGDYMFVAGGTSAGHTASDTILRVHLDTGVIEDWATMPEPRRARASVQIDDTLWMLGGWSQAEPRGARDTIWKVDLNTGFVSEIDTKLPDPRRAGSATIIDDKIYVFGGWGDQDTYKDVLIFNPETEQISTSPHRLPMPMHGTSSATVGDFAYIFGGFTHGYGNHNSILQFHPATGFKLMPTSLPWERSTPGIGTDGDVVYLFGGRDLDGAGTGVPLYMDEILRYDPEMGHITVMLQELPSPRYRLTDFVPLDGAFVSYGGAHEHERFSDILQYTPMQIAVDV